VDEYLNEEIELEDLSDLIDEYTDILRKAQEVRWGTSQPSSSQAPRSRRKDHRQEALQRILALHMLSDGDIARFRSAHLQSGLLELDAVSSWIEDTARDDGEPTVWIRVQRETIENGVSSDDLESLRQLPGNSEETDELRFVSGNARYSRSIPVRTGGVLADLLALSQRIERWYGWDEAAATTFILTDLRPKPRGANARAFEPWPWPIPRRRIELDVPISTSPDEVANLYRKLRDEMLSGHKKPRRSLTERSGDLAVFAAQHSSGYTWEEARTAWNRHYKSKPSYPVSDPAQFIRDSRAAYQRVTGEDLEWDGKKPRVAPTTHRRKKT
jgi:hypothetical protein